MSRAREARERLRSLIGFECFNQTYWPFQHALAWTGWKTVNDAERWCYNNLKTRNWRNYGNYFAFKRKEDYTMFLLVWA